jgi:hypothetical protein
MFVIKFCWIIVLKKYNLPVMLLVVFLYTLRYMLSINRCDGRVNQSNWLLPTSEEDPPFVAPGNDPLTSLKGRTIQSAQASPVHKGPAESSEIYQVKRSLKGIDRESNKLCVPRYLSSTLCASQSPASAGALASSQLLLNVESSRKRRFTQLSWLGLSQPLLHVQGTTDLVAELEETR